MASNLPIASEEIRSLVHEECVGERPCVSGRTEL